MHLLKRLLAPTLALIALAAVFLAPVLAHAAGTVRVEYMRGGFVYSAETLTSSGSSTPSSAAPDFGGTVAGQVRLTPVAGAVVINCCGAAPVATQTNGLYLSAGAAPVTLTLMGGDKLAIIEASAAAVAGSVNLGATDAANLAAAAAGIGAPADAACSTDNGASCDQVALIKRLNQRITTLITALNSPFQTGGSIGNTSFGVSGTLPAFAAPPAVTETPATSGGLLSYVLEPAASDNHAVIKNGAGQVYHIVSFNNSATINYGRLYDAGTGFNGCNSATNLKWEFHIPANTSDAGFVEPIPEGLAFPNGISICVTGGYGQTNTTAATASAISLGVGYK